MAQQGGLDACKRRGVGLPHHTRSNRMGCAFIIFIAFIVYAAPGSLSFWQMDLPSALAAGAVNANSSLFGRYETATRDDMPRLHELRHARTFALCEPDRLGGAIYAVTGSCFLQTIWMVYFALFRSHAPSLLRVTHRRKLESDHHEQVRRVPR